MEGVGVASFSASPFGRGTWFLVSWTTLITLLWQDSQSRGRRKMGPRASSNNSRHVLLASLARHGLDPSPLVSWVWA